MKYCSKANVTLEQIVTPQLFCDAKFTYSHTLYERLRVSPSNWIPVQ